MKFDFSKTSPASKTYILNDFKLKTDHHFVNRRINQRFINESCFNEHNEQEYIRVKRGEGKWLSFSIDEIPSALEMKI